MQKNNFRLITVILFVVIGNCALAQASFSPITINLNFPQFQKLKLDGGYVYVNGGGLRGIILYRANESSYLAFERACPHHPNNAGAIVQVDPSSLFMIDRSCNSSFNFSDGQPTSGPSEYPLIQYRVDIDKNVLKITDEIIN